MRDQMAKLHDRWLAYSLQETFFLSRLRLCWYLRALYERGIKYTEQIRSPLNVWIARNKTKTISLHRGSESDLSKIHLAYMWCPSTSLWRAFKYSAFKGVDISKHCVKLPTIRMMTNFDWFSLDRVSVSVSEWLFGSFVLILSLCWLCVFLLF